MLNQENKTTWQDIVALIVALLAVASGFALLMMHLTKSMRDTPTPSQQTEAVTAAKEERELRARVTRLELDVAKLQEAQKQQAK